MTALPTYEGTKLQDEELRAKLPKPAGYHILIAIPEVSDKTLGGVYIPDKRRGEEETASIIGYVIATGPDAYSDTAKFPSGPWCGEGDFVIFRSYSGTRFKVDKQEFRLINDDTVEAVVEDPRGYSRA
jgi:chaperonin GroES